MCNPFGPGTSPPSYHEQGSQIVDVESTEVWEIACGPRLNFVASLDWVQSSSIYTHAYTRIPHYPPHTFVLSYRDSTTGPFLSAPSPPLGPAYRLISSRRWKCRDVSCPDHRLRLRTPACSCPRTSLIRFRSLEGDKASVQSGIARCSRKDFFLETRPRLISDSDLMSLHLMNVLQEFVAPRLRFIKRELWIIRQLYARKDKNFIKTVIVESLLKCNMDI